jgi:lysyl-tRNA synthetase class 2
VNWRPSASLANLRLRAALLARVRGFFADRGVLEVETPVLSCGAVTDPEIESLRTEVTGLSGVRYLGTSPEFAMKRLLAAGSGDIYQICRAFRDGERGRWHNPEFTIVEWYRLAHDDAALMNEIDDFLAAVLAPYRQLEPGERLSYAAAMERHAGVDIWSAGEPQLAAAAAAHGLDCPPGLDRDGQLDLLMACVVGPRLGRGRPTFLCDYPASQAALARLKPGLPAVAARFELYIDGLELANGFHELTSAAEQRERFMRDLALRRRRGQRELHVDEGLLAALAAGLPDCAGVALGFDRLIAVAAGAASLGEVLAFPIDRA